MTADLTISCPTTPERDRACREYWDGIRAGIQRPEEHNFGLSIGQRIQSNETKARVAIQQAARLRDEIVELRKGTSK